MVCIIKWKLRSNTTKREFIHIGGPGTRRRLSETDRARKDHEPGLYEIRIKGHLNDKWASWFEGMTITREDNGETLLSGPVTDQSALHGLLRKVRDLALPLVSVIQVEPNQAHGPDANVDSDHNRSNR